MRRVLEKDPRLLTDKELTHASEMLDSWMGDLNAKLETLKRQDPFWFYEPSTGIIDEAGHAFLSEFLKPEDIPAKLDGAVHVHASKASIIGITGGNQSQKTTTMTIQDLIKACRVLPPSLEGIYPKEKIPTKKNNRIRIVCEDYTHGILNHNLPAMQHWVPRQYLIDGRWERSWSDKKNMLTLVHPEEKVICGTLEFMSNQAEVTTFQGPPVDRLRYDEEPRHDIHQENLMRFVTSDRLDIGFGMTPTNGLTWVHDELWEAERDPNGNAIEWFQLVSVTNPFANLAVLREICRNIRDYSILKMRLLGEWVSLSGLIYGKYFKRRLNVVPPEKFGLSQYQYMNCACEHVVKDPGDARNANHLAGCRFLYWMAYLGLDPHEVKPTAGVVLCLDRNGTHVVDRCYKGDKTIPEVRDELNNLLRLYRYAFGAVDPHCDSDKTAFDNRNIWKMLSEGPRRIRSLKKADAYKGSILAGVDIIKQLLLEHPATELPQLVVLDRPENQELINSFRTLQRDTWANEDVRGPKDAIREGKHDHHAALRYILQSKLHWRPHVEETPSFEFGDMEACY